MASETHGSILLSTADSVSRMLMKKLDSETGFKPSEWTDNINLLGALPIRTASGTIAHFEDGAEDVPMKSVVATITPKQEGTGDPSPSNPRPLIGTSVLNVMNIPNQLKYETASDSGTASGVSWSFKNGYIRLSGTATANISLSFNLSETVNMNPSQNQIYFNNNKANASVLVYFKRDSTTVHYWGMNSANRIATSWTDSGNENINLVNIGISNGATLDNFILFPCLIKKTEAPTTYTINLGRTIYGGSAEVVEGTGEETHKAVDLGSLTWTYHPASGQYSDFFDCYLPSDSITGVSGIAFDGLCSIYKSIPSANIATSGYDNNVMALAQGTRRFIVCDQRFTNKDDFVAGVTGITLVYPLETPTDFTFEGEEIDSYLGVNNLWADTGDTEVEYRADMNLLIAELEG